VDLQRSVVVVDIKGVMWFRLVIRELIINYLVISIYFVIYNIFRLLEVARQHADSVVSNRLVLEICCCSVGNFLYCFHERILKIN